MSGRDELDPIVRAALDGTLNTQNQQSDEADRALLERMQKRTRQVRERAELEQLQERPHRRERRARRSRSSNRKKRKSDRVRRIELQATGAVPIVGRIRDVGFVEGLRRCVNALVWLRDQQPRGDVWRAMSEVERRRSSVIRRTTEANVLKTLRELLEVATPDESIDRDAAARRVQLAG